MKKITFASRAYTLRALHNRSLFSRKNKKKKHPYFRIKNSFFLKLRGMTKSRTKKETGLRFCINDTDFTCLRFGVGADFNRIRLHHYRRKDFRRLTISGTTRVMPQGGFQISLVMVTTGMLQKGECPIIDCNSLNERNFGFNEKDPQIAALGSIYNLTTNLEMGKIFSSTRGGKLIITQMTPGKFYATPLGRFNSYSQGTISGSFDFEAKSNDPNNPQMMRCVGEFNQIPLIWYHQTK